METTNNKLFSLRPISQLMAIVRNDLKQFNDEGLIDEGTIIKTVMWCNERLGIPIREIKQKCLTVDDFKTKLPVDFEKLYYVSAIAATNTMITGMRNPFNNNFDRDVIYDANLDRGSLGNPSSYSVTINRTQNITVHSVQTMVGLDVDKQSIPLCHVSCPNMRKRGKYTISLFEDHIETPFRSGELYIMYLSAMHDDDGNILFPFHPMITPWYEWTVKEKVVIDAIFNTDMNKEDADYLLKLAGREKAKAWLDAWDITLSKGYGDYVDMQRKKELRWYNEYFKYFQ